MMAALDTHDAKPGLGERRNQFGTRNARSAAHAAIHRWMPINSAPAWDWRPYTALCAKAAAADQLHGRFPAMWLPLS